MFPTDCQPTCLQALIYSFPTDSDLQYIAQSAFFVWLMGTGTLFYHYHYHYNLQHYRKVMTAIEQVSIGSNSAINCHSSLVTDLQFEFAVFTLTFFIHVNLTFTKWWSKNLLLLQFKTLNNLKFSTQLNVYLPENIHTTVQHQMAGNEVRVSEAALAVHM